MPDVSDTPQLQPSRYQAFLASRLHGLEDLRARIWEQGQRNGTPVWVSEIDTKDVFAGKHLDFIQAACLKQVRAVPKFICLLDGSFGTTWNEGQISILEMELATAAFSRRDIWIFCLAPFERPDPRIMSLLRAIKVACPGARVRNPLTPDRVLDEIGRVLEPDNSPPETLGVGSLVADLAQERSPRLNFELSVKDVQFLGGTFAPLFDGRPDKERIATLLADAEQATITPERLAKLWIAIRHLSAAPFLDGQNEEYLPQWERALGQWSSASAWYGLHGHFLLGRLAAVNSLSRIRQRMPPHMTKGLGPPSIFADAGAAASEYYSMAKLVPSRWQRHQLLGKALWNCNAALRAGGVSNPSGLLDIRGHIKFRMFNPVGAIADLRRSLAMRCDAGQSLAGIGESEVHLGAAYARLKLHRLAERLLEEGVAKLRTGDNSNFLAQGLRHLAEFYERAGRKDEAMATLHEAREITRRIESQGQLHQIEEALARMGQSSPSYSSHSRDSRTGMV
jgi:tetratricopeptide (TPR) repeat protein